MRSFILYRQQIKHGNKTSENRIDSREEKNTKEMTKTRNVIRTKGRDLAKCKHVQTSNGINRKWKCERKLKRKMWARRTTRLTTFGSNLTMQTQQTIWNGTRSHRKKKRITNKSNEEIEMNNNNNKNTETNEMRRKCECFCTFDAGMRPHIGNNTTTQKGSHEITWNMNANKHQMPQKSQ